ncbi:colanic acid/biofilm transcriptional regulator [Shigella sonnei]|nr:colanic acid/biofilm transcriptional regulator [Shigella sonnei]
MIIHFNTPGELLLPCRQGWTENTRRSIGALKPGARLITKNLAEQLGMSITPVREALLRLVSVNALSVAPAQAFTVPEVGKRQLDEINRIRYELELMAVALAVEN